MVSRVQRIRLLIFLLFAQVGLGVMILRILHIELNSQRLRERSEKLFGEGYRVNVLRGRIVDRNGNELALNVEALSIFADPARIDDPEEVAARLSEALGLDKGKILEKLSRRGRRFVWVARKLDISLMKPFLEVIRRHKIKGLGFRIEERRIYPKRKLLAQALGFVNFDGIGVDGLEKFYDEEIRCYQRSIPLFKGCITPDLNLPRYNSELVLTVDEMIQYIAESELEEACRRWMAAGGCVIVMNPKTGEVLAMASYPSFDLNEYGSTPESFKRNRAIWMCYEPGSVFKIVPVAAAIESGVLTPDSKVFCENGELDFNGHIINDISPHGWLTVEEVVEKSSNIGAIKIARKLGRERFERFIRLFGFGQKTGIDLPYERIGNLRALKEWSDEAVLTFIPFGQGITVTPIQMLNALNVIASGGVMVRPHLAKEIRDSSGRVVRRFETQIVRRVISRMTADKVKEMLVKVVESGTGVKARIEGVKVAGKTGTAQKAGANGYSKDKYVATFAGFLPADDPRYSIIVVIDEPKGEHKGGEVAAPVFKRIAERILKYERMRFIFARRRADEAEGAASRR
ncbi:hypothetical protein DRP77_02100 [Candidatus Poribacteria bacterium]|nr:MAG: hypothetical protein DRP77_02100 [Candidatus Poribacteria bacterium]